ncbi:MAG TPA: hypothetical protein VIS07_23140 [Candidatus Binatia bacterium]
MRTLGMIRAATPPPPDLTPRLRARLRELKANERVTLELPEFGWGWRLAALVAVATPLLVPEPLRFLAASGLL